MGGRRQARCGRSLITLSTSWATRSSSSDANDDDSLIKRSKACAIIEESSEESSLDKEGSGGYVDTEGVNQAGIQSYRGAKTPKAPNAAVF